MKQFEDLKFINDTRYPHEEFGQSPKYNASFEAGKYSLSVVYGGGCYGYGPSSDTYEIALFDDNDDMVALQHDEQIAGWQSADDISKLMHVMHSNPERIGNHLECLIS